ncbi:OLC1v1022153C1 [Oldenlandia corymbosa var. corymbosa]|uniref:OLC1v1022153C1 n=1 Tax=Oldenlandia corymbosa var. corymbosa TaxID=529605 RepID=A0AAV1BX78_OLDCO|nr:OLC1v1022153C1 [Oldenlandia corymbosa var. corymbosa]
MEVDSKKFNNDPESTGTKKGGKKRRSKWVCWGWVISAVLAIGLLILILSLTVFKAKRPTTTVNSVSLRDFHLSLDILRLRVLLNVSVDANIAVHNPNKVSFHYDNSTALLKYRDTQVGEVPIPAGKIGSGQTLPMNVTLTLMADRLLAGNSLFSDVRSGTLVLSTYTRITGDTKDVPSSPTAMLSVTMEAEQLRKCFTQQPINPEDETNIRMPTAELFSAELIAPSNQY